MSDTDFAALTEPLVLRFWGEPATKTKTQWRWGNGGSRSYKVDEHVWYDHEAGEGGGAIKLVMREEGLDEAGAITWMQEQGLIEGRQPRKEALQRREPPFLADEPQEPEQPPASTPEAVMKPVKGYRYTDGDGNVLYEVIRYQQQNPGGSWVIGKSGNPKKTFKQRRPDGRGGYVWGLGDVEHTIWRRPEVEIAISEGKTIYLAEGEKDVETLEQWGLVGTTNSGGAANWKPAFAEFLRGADVVILGDDDDAGQKRVDDVARSLRGVAARVRAVTFWDEQKDVTDWRDRAEGTLARLNAIVDALPDWKPRPPKSSFGAQTSATIATKPVTYDWLIKNLIERNGILIIAGESMAGKSFLVMDMGMKVARGVDYAERRVRQGAVIHMAVEDGKGTELRFKGYLKAHNLDAADIPYVVMDPYANGGLGFSLMNDEQVDKFIAECLEWKAYYGSLEFIIIDTLSMATEGLDENSSGEASKVLGRVNRIRERTGATVCLVHHMNAGGTKVRGSTAIVANVPNVIEVKPMMTIPHNRREEPRPILDSNGRPIRRARLAKNKNGVANKAWTFVLQEILLSDVDQDGDPYSTMFCARPARHSSEEPMEDVTKLVGDQKLVFDALVAVHAEKGQAVPSGVNAGSVKQCVSQADFVAAVRKRMNFTAGEEEVEARNREMSAFLKRTTTALMNAGYMGRDNDQKVVWWTQKSDRPQRRRQPDPAPIDPPGTGVPEDVKREISQMEAPF